MNEQWLEQFDAVPGYLNTASVGVPPRIAVDAMRACLEDWRHGRSQPADFDVFVARARSAWARLSNVDPAWVAIGSTVSALVGVVADSLDAGACVLLAEDDFTSVMFPFLAQQARGVRVVEASLSSLIESIDATIDLVAVSAVQSADGRVLDLDRLKQAAARHGVAVLLDTTQSCGWLPVDCSWVDYTVCAAYKWLLSPRGVAFMAVRPERLANLSTSAAGWYAGEDIWSSIYGSPLRLSADARRLDTSPAWFCWVGAAHSLELLAAMNGQAISAHNIVLANEFLRRLDLAPQDSAIVTIDIPHAAERLAQAGVRTAIRAGRVRVSFHLYNSHADLEIAVQAITEVLT